MAVIDKVIGKSASVSYKVRIRKAGHPTQTKTFKSLVDAENWARIVETEMARGVFHDRTEAERMTLREALIRYYSEISRTKRGVNAEKWRIKAWLPGVELPGEPTRAQKEVDARAKALAENRLFRPLPPPKKASESTMAKLVDRSMASLRAPDFTQYRDQRLKSVAPATVKNDLALISHVFTIAAKEWELQLTNPIKAMRLPKVANRRNRVFENGEEELLLAALADSGCEAKKRNVWMLPLVIVATETAMRQGELLALQWKHVDLKAGVAHLPETTNDDARHVPLSSRARTTLAAMPRAIDGKVFPTSASAVKQSFARACARAKLEDFRFDDLRHVATSRLAEKLSMHELMKVTGHKDTRMLARYYNPRVEDLARKIS